MRPSRFAWLMLFALAAPGGAAAAPTLDGDVRLRIVTGADTLAADEGGLWQLELRIVNRLGLGIYLDSLMLQVREAGTGAVTGMNLRQLGAAFSNVSAGDSVAFRFGHPASCERGLLVMRWYGHDGQKTAHVAADSIAVGPGEFEKAHPSRVVTAGGRRVEVVEFAPPDTATRAPGVLLVHGPGGHARSLLRVAGRLAAMGYGVVAVSQPGCGLSDGPRDEGGPASVAALEAALGALRGLPRVDPDRLAAWGQSRGATAALRLATRRPAGLRAVIAQGGVFDPAAWPAGPVRVQADVLLLHGLDDAESPVARVRALAEQLRAGGARVDTLFAPGGAPASRWVLARRPLEFLARLSSR